MAVGVAENARAFQSGEGCTSTEHEDLLIRGALDKPPEIILNCQNELVGAHRNHSYSPGPCLDPFFFEI